MIDSAVTDFPDPDSPTMATVSPQADGKRDPADRRHDALGRRERDRKIVDGERGAHARLLATAVERSARARSGAAHGDIMGALPPTGNATGDGETASRAPRHQTFSGSETFRFISSAGTGLPWPKCFRPWWSGTGNVGASCACARGFAIGWSGFRAYARSRSSRRRSP